MRRDGDWTNDCIEKKRWDPCLDRDEEDRRFRSADDGFRGFSFVPPKYVLNKKY